MNTTSKPGPQKPSPKKPSKKSSTTTEVNPDAAALQQAMQLLAPLGNFHKAVDTATENDLRLYWDVRLVRGKSTAFAHIAGTTSMPNVLSYKMVVLGSSMIEREITDKIIRPLIAIFQTEAEQWAETGLVSVAEAQRQMAERQAARDKKEDGEEEEANVFSDAPERLS